MSGVPAGLGTDLDPWSVPLEGISLVEASAGTGKTHAITDLYVRLFLERGLSVEQILVVTYTKAATAELRGRIRARLLEVQDQVRRGAVREPGLAALLERVRVEAGPALTRRIALGLQSFDQAPIHTIHGFCQRVLQDSAFESAQPFAVELVTDDSEIVAEEVHDFWRRRMAGASPLWVAYLMKSRASPEELAAWVRGHQGKPYLRVDRPSLRPSAPTRERLARVYLEAYRRARDQWAASGQSLARALQSPDLDGRRFSPARVVRNLEGLGRYFAVPARQAPLPSRQVTEALDRFSTRFVEAHTRKGRRSPQHPFFAAAQHLAQAAKDLAEVFAASSGNLRADLLAEVDRRLAERHRTTRVHRYNDLLTELAAALAGHGGERLAASLARRYPCALIDEFQDTDPTQLEIFTAVYAARPPGQVSAFLVGDPKQAIYGFRGADVFAYLAGRARAGRRYGLRLNRRSVPALVDAVNALFESHPQPFGLGEIAFRPGAAVTQDTRLAVAGDDPAPFRIWWMSPSGERKLTKRRASVAAARGTAREVARLLAAAGEGRARLGDRALGGHDIAVLVRTNEQGRQTQAALEEVGIASVRPAQDNVLLSREAGELEVLLRALVEPHRESSVRAALSSELLGVPAHRLPALHGDCLEWDRWLERVHAWRELWQRQGFSRMYREVMETRSLVPRLLSYRGGERRLTNWLQLGELVQQAESTAHANPEQLLRWFETRAARSGIASEESEQRLESDADRVRIVTMHGAKGLQYPIVFCPFAWDARSQGDATPVYHDPADGYCAVLDLSGRSDPGVRAQVEQELRSDALRLLYVALTRARHRCYLAVGPVSKVEGSALGWLFGLCTRGRSADGPSLEAQLRAGLSGWVERAGGGARLDDLPHGPVSPPATAPGRVRRRQLVPRTFRGVLAPRWRVSSFTALRSGLSAELPDHDVAWEGEAGTAPPGRAGVSGAPEAEEGRSGPRGARAGTALHAMLERLDFSRPVHAQGELVTEALHEHGLGAEHRPEVCALLQRVLDTPLEVGGKLRLCDLDPVDRVAELEFHFPVDAVELGPLIEVLQAAGYLRSPEARLELDAGRSLQGYLKGYVDLVFRRGSRFYLVDYKSHWLGSSPDDYRPEALAALMRRNHYPLQYLIYLVALERYLRVRVAGYRLEEQLGGAFYLFLRGMQPERPGSGVFFDRPPSRLIRALGELLGEGGPGAVAAPRQQVLWP